MNPRELHPSLDGHAPAPKPNGCVDCGISGAAAVLVPLHFATSIFICAACSAIAAEKAFHEAQRRVSLAILRADAVPLMRSAI